MNKVTFYHMAEKLLYTIYTGTFSEEKLAEIIEEETRKKQCWDIAYEEANFLNNLLKNYPWYVIPSLINRLNSIVNDNQDRAASTNLTCNLILGALNDLDFKIKERIKTIICINISQCLLLYYKSAGNIEFERLEAIMKKNFEFTEDLTNAEIAEPEEEYSQMTLFEEETKPKNENKVDNKENKKSEQELSEIISIKNTEQKYTWFEETKKNMRNLLNRKNLDTFKNIILTICNEISNTQNDKKVSQTAFEVMNYLYESTLKAWKKPKKTTSKDAPLLHLRMDKK